MGQYPVESVATMARLAERTEQALDCDAFLQRHEPTMHQSVTDSISYASRQTARRLGATAILTSTQSGHTARMVSKCRPGVPVIAVTPRPSVLRKLLLIWGVIPLLGRKTENTDEMIYAAITAALNDNLIANGGLVVITAGVPVGVPGTTNLLKVHVVGDVAVQGDRHRPETGDGPRAGGAHRQGRLQTATGGHNGYHRPGQGNGALSQGGGGHHRRRRRADLAGGHSWPGAGNPGDCRRQRGHLPAGRRPDCQSGHRPGSGVAGAGQHSRLNFRSGR